MVIFDGKNIADLYCADGEAGCVHRALEDLRGDLFALSGKRATIKRYLPVDERGYVLVGTIGNQELAARFPIAVAELAGVWEGYRMLSFGNAGENLLILGSDARGAMWGIYDFARVHLGVDPLRHWTGIEPEPRLSLDLGDVDCFDRPRTYKFRGWFINDEDLLSEWLPGGGTRYADYPYYKQVVHPDALSKVLETALRLKQNLIIPASLIDIDNPAEENLVRMASERGLFISQHHVEPLGVSHFTWDRYWRRRGLEVKPSFITERDRYVEIWTDYVSKWAKYDNVIWQLGLRGRGDRPVWFHDSAVPPSAEARGALISDAIATQRAIVAKVLGREDFLCTTTLWMEGSELHDAGHLRFPEKTIIVFADHGPSQMWGEDFHAAARKRGTEYGVYYHVAFWGDGPHLVQGTSPEKIRFNYAGAVAKGDTAYSILNVTNVRETVLGASAVAELTWDFTAFDVDRWLESFCAQRFEGPCEAEAGAGIEIASLYRDFYRAYVPLENDRLDGSMVLLDGMTRIAGLNILKILRGESINPDLIINSKIFPAKDPLDFARRYRDATKSGLERFQAAHLRALDVLERFDLKPAARSFFIDNLVVQLELIIGLYGWLHHLAAALEAKESDATGSDAVEAELRQAAYCLGKALLDRKKAECGPWTAWYRGDRKMALPLALARTRETAEEFTQSRLNHTSR